MTPEDLVAAVARDAAGHMDNVLDPGRVNLITRDKGKSAVVDASLAATIDGHALRDHAVLLISNPQFPDAVEEAVAKIDEIFPNLTSPAADRMLRPLHKGRVESCSYAVFPRLRPLLEGRIGRRIEPPLLDRHVFDWLVTVARTTKKNLSTEKQAEMFTRPLEYLVGEAALPDAIRRQAEACLPRVAGAGLFSVVEHGDFWSGNILLVPEGLRFGAALRGDFRIIDWGGARIDGYPVTDLVRYLMSSRRPTARSSGRAMARYCTQTAILPDHVVLYGLGAIGRLGLNLNAFPKASYITLSERMFHFFQHHGYLD